MGSPVGELTLTFVALTPDCTQGGLDSADICQYIYCYIIWNLPVLELSCVASIKH